MAITRIRLHFVDTVKAWEIRATSADHRDWTPKPRPLRVGSTDQSPLPPTDDHDFWVGQEYAALCDGPDDSAISTLRREVLLGDPGDQDVELLGGYLFAVLLGRFWNDIHADDRLKLGPLELELSFEPTMAHLQAFPWEMLFFEGKPLVVDAARPVAITRVVDRVAGPTQVGFPLRVLFVVGQMDESLQAGAEYLAILRGVTSSFSAAGTDTAAMLSVRSLVDATAEDLEALADAWNPQIVHLVCHGGVSSGHPSLRLTKRDANAVAPDQCDAGRLMTLLKGPKRTTPLPALVVVNVCQSADAGTHLSFAAELVEGGVAAAVGMAGEVASGACRVFTHALYRALAGYRPLATAVAEGQRAAALHFDKSKLSIEWARPALFVANGPVLEFKLDESQKALATAVSKVRGKPVTFCDRYAALDAFGDFALRVHHGGEQLLAYEQTVDRGEKKFESGETVPYQIGKTHLLGEIEWHGLIEGLLPCFLRTDRGDEIPNNLLMFALRLAMLLDGCRPRFALEPRQTSQALKLARAILKQPPLEFSPETLSDFLVSRDLTLGALKDGVGAGPKPITVESVGAVIRADIEQLVLDVHQVCTHTRGVLVILDDFHAYKGYFDLLLDQVNEYGLGTAKARAPVVIAFSAKGVGVDIRKRLTQASYEVSKRSLRKLLEPFPTGPEADIAYGQYLWSRRLAPARKKAVRDRVKALFQMMHEEVEGVPSFLPTVNQAIKYASKNGDLVINDDEAIFQRMSDGKL